MNQMAEIVVFMLNVLCFIISSSEVLYSKEIEHMRAIYVFFIF